jgi:hypothetical protein
VKAYTKKDGTHVEAYDRKVQEHKVERVPLADVAKAARESHPTTPPTNPASRTDAATRLADLARTTALTRSDARVTTDGGRSSRTPQLRVVIDPVTGRKTLTNAPEPSVVTVHPHIPPSASTTRSAAATTVVRDGRGTILRSEAAKAAFMRQTGYAHGRSGYVVDHVKALACGGADLPSNMQWQTIEAAKAKDRTERIGCR